MRATNFPIDLTMIARAAITPPASIYFRSGGAPTGTALLRIRWSTRCAYYAGIGIAMHCRWAAKAVALLGHGPVILAGTNDTNAR